MEVTQRIPGLPLQRSPPGLLSPVSTSVAASRGDDDATPGPRDRQPRDPAVQGGHLWPRTDLHPTTVFSPTNEHPPGPGLQQPRAARAAHSRRPRRGHLPKRVRRDPRGVHTTSHHRGTPCHSTPAHPSGTGHRPHGPRSGDSHTELGEGLLEPLPWPRAPGLPPQAQGHPHTTSGLPAPGPRGAAGTAGAERPRRGAQALPRLLPAPTFLHGLDDTSKEALNALLCWVVRMVLGRLGRLWSLPSSPPPCAAPRAGLQRPSSSSLLPERSRGRRLVLPTRTRLLVSGNTGRPV